MISGGDWITFNTRVWALIYGMKEVFRIAEGRDKSAPGALIAGIWGAIKAGLFGRSEEEIREEHTIKRLEWARTKSEFDRQVEKEKVKLLV